MSTTAKTSHRTRFGGLKALRLVEQLNSPAHPVAPAPTTVEVPRLVLIASAPLPARLSPRAPTFGQAARGLARQLVTLLAAVLAPVLHPETVPPRPHAGLVVGSALACLLIIAYAITQILTSGATR